MERAKMNSITIKSDTHVLTIKDGCSVFRKHDNYPVVIAEDEYELGSIKFIEFLKKAMSKEE
jgi:hypothetical protein